MNYIFYPFLLFMMVWMNGCDEEHSTLPSAPSPALIKTDTPAPKTPTLPTKEPVPVQVYEFNLSSAEEGFSLLTVKENNYHFSNIAEPIILVNFFSTWCPPCRGELPHLNNLQKRYHGKIFLMGLLIHDDLSPEALNSCIASQKVNYFIANNQAENERFATFIAPKLKLKARFNLPLMIMFLNGKYYTHYLGTVPEEMIESDIKQALKNIKGSK